VDLWTCGDTVTQRPANSITVANQKIPSRDRTINTGGAKKKLSMDIWFDFFQFVSQSTFHKNDIANQKGFQRKTQSIMHQTTNKKYRETLRNPYE